MDQSSLWWVIAGVLVAAELTTGTFYLLMMAVGAAAGAVAAHLGLSETAQVALAGVVGSVTTGGWHLLRARKAAKTHPHMGAQDNPSLSLDLGQTVQVTAWNEQGTAQVSYRGAAWSASMKHPTSPAELQPGTYRIAAMQGNHLLLEKV